MVKHEEQLLPKRGDRDGFSFMVFVYPKKRYIEEISEIMQPTSNQKYDYLNHRKMKEDIKIFDTEDNETITLKNDRNYFFICSPLDSGERVYQIAGCDISKEDYENAFDSSEEIINYP